jgi:hypothetical protein
MTTQVIRKISVDFADTDFIQFKYGGKLYEYDDVENEYSFVKWLEGFEDTATALEENLIEDLASDFIASKFKSIGDLLTKCEIVD